MERLAYYMREDYEDTYHVFFPGMSAGYLRSQWNRAARDILSTLYAVLSPYIASLPIPAAGETGTIQIVPQGFFGDLVRLIDERVPGWNLVQRTLFYARLSVVLYEAGQKLWTAHSQGAVLVELQKNSSDVIAGQSLYDSQN